MSNPGNWPRGALPLGPSVYEDAMAPIYAEAVWRERNFYKAESSPPVVQTDPTMMSQPSAGIIETVTGGVGEAVGGFKDFLLPAGKLDLWRVGIIVGGLLVIGYAFGKNKNKR